MVSKSDLKIVEVYELLGEVRYRICVKGTNILVNVNSASEEDAFEKAIGILVQAGLDDESLEKLRKI
ncbi:MAG: hypothetical protein QXJ84_02680, partial [Desulfurococcaceae archaeon]